MSIITSRLQQIMLANIFGTWNTHTEVSLHKLINNSDEPRQGFRIQGVHVVPLQVHSRHTNSYGYQFHSHPLYFEYMHHIYMMHVLKLVQ